MPRLAAFPKAYMQALCREGSMRVLEWLDLAATLPIEGVEWYAGFLENADPARWPEFRAAAAARGLLIPMVCCSPDFTHPDRVFREREIEKQKGWIDMTAALGGSFCRVLSGQRRPELSIDEGVELARGAGLQAVADDFAYVVVPEQPVLVAIGAFTGAVDFHSGAGGGDLVAQGLGGGNEIVHAVFGGH